eukprot:2659391-Rhodomonas_salina.2
MAASNGTKANGQWLSLSLACPERVTTLQPRRIVLRRKEVSTTPSVCVVMWRGARKSTAKRRRDSELADPSILLLIVRPNVPANGSRKITVSKFSPYKSSNTNSASTVVDFIRREINTNCCFVYWKYVPIVTFHGTMVFIP